MLHVELRVDEAGGVSLTVGRRYHLFWLQVLVSAGACIEYSPDRLQDSGVQDAPKERCDGVDDDGDGDVDEGFPDGDGDGVVDCLQCSVSSALAAASTRDATCSRQGLWDVETAWEFYDVDDDCRLTAVADVTGDGVGDLVCSDYDRVYLLNGRDRSVAWMHDGAYKWAATAVGDADKDGRWDIAMLDAAGSVVLLDGSGSEIWRSNKSIQMEHLCTPSHTLLIGDLGSDGRNDVVTASWAIFGRNGIRRVWLPFENRHACVNLSPLDFATVDIDLDGRLDVLGAGAAFDGDGEMLWSVPEATDWIYSAPPIVMQLDADPAPEVAWVAGIEIRFVDDDGSLLTLVPLDATSISDTEFGASVPCAGNLDDDDLMELVYTTRAGVRALDADGTPLWASNYGTPDGTIYNGCSVFDFDGDGVHEILTGNEHEDLILDGRTGRVLFEHARSAATLGEVPVVADLDGDGSVEIVVSNLGGGGSEDDAGVRVYTHARGGWPPGLRYWAHNNWSGVGVGPDGAIDRDPPHPWLTEKIWRGQPRNLVSANLRVSIDDACEPESEAGLATVAFRLENPGPGGLPAGLPVAVYGADDALIEVLTLAEAVPAGWASATMTVDVPPATLRAGIRIVGDDDGKGGTTVDDCDRADNTATFRAP